MGAPRARRWKLLPFHSKAKPPPPPLPVPAALLGKEQEEEELPREFLCPILGAPMADPVILPSGRTYERACVQACAELSLCPPGEDAPGAGGAGVAIPNDALRAAIRTWRARSGRAPPAAPSAAAAREAVVRAVPTPRPQPGRSSSNLSCSSRASAASTSSSSSRSSSEITTLELEMSRAKEAAKEATAEELEVGRLAAKAVEDGDEWEVEAAMAALRQATRESASRRRALCVLPRLLAALRRVLLSARTSPAARADAAAVLANLSLEPENRVPIVRAGAVPALIEVVAGTGAPEACEHAAGALFGLALHEGNRAAIGVLGAVPPLLAVLVTRDSHCPRARRDAGMALYHLSLAAVNQSKLARAPGAGKSLLSVASDPTEPLPIRRLALMVTCNVAACPEGRTALMDAGAVAKFSAILSDDARGSSELQEWCVAALYDMSRGSPRFRGLARAAGADRPLILIAEQAQAGVHKDMARKALRAMLGLEDINGGGLHDFTSSGRNDDDDESGTVASSVPARRRRAASWGAAPATRLPNPHHWRSVCID